MFTKNSREAKDDFFITFHINGVALSEYIPKEYSSKEVWLRSAYLNFLFNLNRYNPNFYYWHVKHLMLPDFRKTEDLLFMMHVYADHDGKPEIRRERWYFNHLRSIYGYEYDELIAPKVDLEKNGGVPTHDYALAYYKRWLRKPRPIMKQLYHGVGFYEFKDVFTELDDILKSEKEKNKRKRQYQTKKLKQSNNLD